jgi:alanine racemase
MRWAWAEIDEAAIAHNVSVLSRHASPSQSWAVVKADGYGHGAVTAARAALSGGASGLCVALVQEGVELREAGIGAPILVLSEQPHDELADAVGHGLHLTVYRPDTIEQLERLGAVKHPVHLKIDTGMHRAGCDPSQASALATAIGRSSAAELAGVFTHLACADDPSDSFTRIQIERFDAVLSELSNAGVEVPLVHIGNSAGAMAHPDARRDVVRLGIAIYGISPGGPLDQLACDLDLRPALSLKARVSTVRRVAAGDGVSYGLRHRFTADTTVAVLPLGYADGVPRRLGLAGGEVLLHGRRCPIRGVVTMDQIVVEVGDLPVAVGDEAVLIGRQGDESVTASDWAALCDTIGYEIVCGISRRIERKPV